MPRFKRNYNLQLGHLLEIASLPYGTVDEKHCGIGMVDDVLSVVGVEIRQYRHNGRPIGDCGHKAYHPCGGISTQKRHLVTRFQPYLLVEQMQPCYPAGHLAVTHNLVGTIFRQRR